MVLLKCRKLFSSYRENYIVFRQFFVKKKICIDTKHFKSTTGEIITINIVWICFFFVTFSWFSTLHSSSSSKQFSKKMKGILQTCTKYNWELLQFLSFFFYSEEKVTISPLPHSMHVWMCFTQDSIRQRKPKANEYKKENK